MTDIVCHTGMISLFDYVYGECSPLDGGSPRYSSSMGPPNPSNIIKCATHRKGYMYRAQIELRASPPNSNTDEASLKTGVSVLRTTLTSEAEDGFFPLEMVSLLRERLSWVYPELGKRDFVSTRLCWYLDTPDGDWLID